MYKIIEKIRDLTEVVFVGGTSEFIQGMREGVDDIDIVTTDITPFIIKFGTKVKKWNNNYFKDVVEKYNIWIDGVNVDIFIKNSLPSHILVNGYKVETIASMIEQREHFLNSGFFEKLANTKEERAKYQTIIDNLKSKIQVNTK